MNVLMLMGFCKSLCSRFLQIDIKTYVKEPMLSPIKRLKQSWLKPICVDLDVYVNLPGPIVIEKRK